MDSKTTAFAVCVLVSGLALPGEGNAQTVFTSNRLMVISATDGSETVTEIDYSTVVDGGSNNTSTTIRTIGDSTALEAPFACAFSPEGNLYVTTSNPTTPAQGEIVVFAPDGTQVGSAIAPANLSAPRGIAFGPDGHIFVCSSGNGVVMELDSTGTLVNNIGLGAGMQNPTGIAVGPNGNLFVSDPGADTVYELVQMPTTAVVRQVAPGLLSDPTGVCFGPRGHLYVVDKGTNTVKELDENLGIVQTIGPGTLASPSQIALGFDGNLYVTSEGSNRVVVFDGDETGGGNAQIAVVGGTAGVTLAGPTGLAFSPQRFGCDISGKVFPANAAAVKRNELFKNNVGPIVVWAPGTRFAMLTLNDAATTEDLASIFGIDRFAFSGFQTTLDITANKRSFAGQMIPAPNLDTGSATIFLDVNEGKVNAEGQFTMKAFTGRIIIQARNAIYQGKIESLKEIKP